MCASKVKRNFPAVNIEEKMAGLKYTHNIDGFFEHKNWINDLCKFMLKY